MEIVKERKPMKCILARHGKTDFNEKNLFAGQNSDARLTAEGHAHAKNLALMMENFKLDAIYSSPMTRAIETARPTSELKGLDITADQRLIEMDFGIADGKSIHDPEMKGMMARRTEDPNYRIPGGETYNEVMERVAGCIADLESYEMVLAVAHFGTNRALISLLTRTPMQDLSRLIFQNDIVYIIDKNGGDCEWFSTITGKSGHGLLMK
jgi:broad specificity phosphatase PhoE